MRERYIGILSTKSLSYRPPNTNVGNIVTCNSCDEYVMTLLQGYMLQLLQDAQGLKGRSPEVLLVIKYPLQGFVSKVQDTIKSQ